MRKIAILGVTLLALAAVGCGKKEEQAPETMAPAATEPAPAPAPAPEAAPQEAAPAEGGMTEGEGAAAPAEEHTEKAAH